MVEVKPENLKRGKKILFVTTISGTIRAFLLPYAQAIRERGGIVDAMCSGEVDEIEKYFRKIWSVNFSRNPFLALALLPSTLMRIRKIIIAEDYDIVHVHTPIASFVTRLSIALIKGQKRPKVIYTAHGFHFHPLGNKIANLIYLSLEKFAARYTDYLLTINEWDYNVASKKNLMPKERVVYIKGIGVDTNVYNPDGVRKDDIERIRKEAGCINDEKLISIIAELIPRKRHVDALNAIGNIKGIKLLLVGDGRLRKRILKRIKKMSLSDKVHLLGYRSDIPQILKASAVLLLPSVREGLPRVVMEAMAIGTPVIASDIIGVRELLSDGCGILVEPKNPKAIADAIKRLLENKEETRIMAMKARDKVKREFDIRVVLPKHLEVYDRALIE